MNGRVVILVENLPVPLDRRVWQEARALHAAGWSVSVISPRGEGEMSKLREQLDGIEILRFPQRAASGLLGYVVEYLPSLVFTLAWLLYLRLRTPIDVIQGCNPPDLFWVLGRIGTLWGSAYVYDQHDVNPELVAAKFGDRGRRAALLQRVSRWLEMANYRSAALVLSPNDSYRMIAMSRGGVPRSRTALVRNAPNTGVLRSLAAGIDPDPLRVGYVGVMGSQDGVEILVEAWDLLTDMADMGGAQLELVGDGEARPALQEDVIRRHLGDSVHFHGYRRPEYFVPLLAGCAVCVSPDPPSPFNDVSTMVKIVDYLAIGRPIVAFALPETIATAGEALAPVLSATPQALAQKIAELLRDPVKRSAMSHAASERVQELGLDWSRSAASLTAAYAGLRQMRTSHRD